MSALVTVGGPATACGPADWATTVRPTAATALAKARSKRLNPKPAPGSTIWTPRSERRPRSCTLCPTHVADLPVPITEARCGTNPARRDLATEISPNVPMGVRGRPASTRAAQKVASSVNAMNSCWTHRLPGPPYGTRNPGQPRFLVAGARLVPTTPPHAAARRAEPWRREPARGCGSASRTQNERNAPHGGVSFVAGAGLEPATSRL